MSTPRFILIAAILCFSQVSQSAELTVTDRDEIKTAIRVSYSIYFLLDKLNFCINNNPDLSRKAATKHCDDVLAREYRSPAKYYHLALAAYPVWKDRSIFYATNISPIGHMIDFAVLEKYLGHLN